MMGFSAEDAGRRIAGFQQLSGGSLNVNYLLFPEPSITADVSEPMRARLQAHFDAKGLGAVPEPTRAAGEVSREHLSMLMRAKPQMVSFHFGLPDREIIDAIKDAGIFLISSATTVAEARMLEQRGVDAIIAQGTEAGGHRGSFLGDAILDQVGTLALVPQIARATGLPVIAAGGIADAAGVRAVLALGAAAAQVGTSYLLCPEATTSPVHRAALASDRAQRTVITNLFTGRPARGIVNRLIEELGAMSDLAPAFPLAAAALAPLRACAERAGSDAFSPLWAGQNTTGCRSIAAAQLTRELAGVA